MKNIELDLADNMQVDDKNNGAKSGAFAPVLGRILTQQSLNSLDYLTAFQADDEGSIPFTRSSFFNPLDHLRSFANYFSTRPFSGMRRALYLIRQRHSC